MHEERSGDAMTAEVAGLSADGSPGLGATVSEAGPGPVIAGSVALRGPEHSDDGRSWRAPTALGHHVRAGGAPPTLSLEELDRRADAYAGRSRARRTVEGYAGDMGLFQRWATARGLVALPADASTVRRYIVDLADRCRPATIGRHLAAIASAHRAIGAPSPTTDDAVRLTFSGIANTLGTRPDARDPLRLRDLEAMIVATPGDLRGARDVAVLTFAFWSALRRSELVAVTVTDLHVAPEGYVVVIERSKTDQVGRGRAIALCRIDGSVLCPIAALQTWLEVARVQDGAIFRTVDRWGNVAATAMSGAAVARTVKRAAQRAGLPNAERLAAHSARRGFISEAALVADELAIANQSGHRSVRQLRHYAEQARIFDDNAATALARTVRGRGSN